MNAFFTKLLLAIKEKRLLRALRSRLIKKPFYLFACHINYFFNGSFKKAYQEYLQLFKEKREFQEINKELHDQVSKKTVDNFILAKNADVDEIYRPGAMWSNIINKIETYSKWQHASDDNILKDALYEFYRNDLILAFAGDGYSWTYNNKDFNKKLQVYMIRKRYKDFIRQKFAFDPRMISTTDIGRNIYVNCNGCKISFKAVRFAYYINRIINSKLARGNDPIIGELGSGAGELAILTKKIIPGCTYVCFDLPTTLMVASYNIKMTFPDLKIGLYEDFINLKEINEDIIRKFDIVMLPNWCIDLIQGEAFDLFINIGSLSEMDRDMIKNYISRIEKATRGFFYTINRNVRVKEHESEDVPLDEFPFSDNSEIISKKYDLGSDLFHRKYGIYRANYWELILKCRK